MHFYNTLTTDRIGDGTSWVEERVYKWTSSQVESGVVGAYAQVDHLPVQDIYRRNVCINGYFDQYRPNVFIRYGFAFYRYFIYSLFQQNAVAPFEYQTNDSIETFIWDKTTLRYADFQYLTINYAQGQYPITSHNVKYNTFYSIKDCGCILYVNDRNNNGRLSFSMKFILMWLYKSNYSTNTSIPLYYFSIGRSYIFNFILWSLSWVYDMSKTAYISYTLFSDLFRIDNTVQDAGTCRMIMYYMMEEGYRVGNVQLVTFSTQFWFPLFVPSNLYFFNNKHIPTPNYVLYGINTKQYVSSCNWLLQFQVTNLVHTWFGNYRMLINILFASYLTGSTSNAAMDIVYTSGSFIEQGGGQDPIVQKTTLKPLMTGDGVSTLYGINLNHIPTFYTGNKGEDGNIDVLMTQEGSEHIEYYFTTRDMEKDYIYAFNYTGGRSNLYMFESIMKWQIESNLIVTPTAFTITNISSQSPWNGLSLASNEYIYAIHANADFSNIIVYTAINEKNGTTEILIDNITDAGCPAPYNIAKIKGMYFFARQNNGVYKRISNANTVGCSAFLSSLTSHYLFQIGFTVRHPINKKKDFLVQQTQNTFGDVTNHHAVVVMDKIQPYLTYFCRIEKMIGSFDDSLVSTIWDIGFGEPDNVLE